MNAIPINAITIDATSTATKYQVVFNYEVTIYDIRRFFNLFIILFAPTVVNHLVSNRLLWAFFPSLFFRVWTLSYQLVLALNLHVFHFTRLSYIEYYRHNWASSRSIRFNKYIFIAMHKSNMVIEQVFVMSYSQQIVT